MTMFGRPDDPITEAVFATPYPRSPSIVVAYPQLNDWTNLYDPFRYKGNDWAKDMHADFRHHHERTVKEQLDLIFRRSTGRAVLAEMAARSSFPVMILPFDFLRAANRGPVNASTIPASLDAPSATVTIGLDVWERGRPICGRKADGQNFCFHHKGTGTGGSVDIYFRADRYKGYRSADEVLLHELVHASRMARGVFNQIPMSGSWANREEFFANLVANMYLSQNGFKNFFDYGGDPIDAAKFLDSGPDTRSAVEGLLRSQPTLFVALRGVTADFNPVRQFFDEL